MRNDEPGLDRRKFLAGAAAGGAALTFGAAPALAGGRKPGKGHGHGHDHDHGGGWSIPRDNISIQLYTLRDQMAADAAGTLKALGRIGYKTVEHAGFVGRTAAEFKQLLRDAGLRATSGHQGIPQPFDAAAWQAQLNDARTIGQRYIVNPASPITYFPSNGDLSQIKGLTTSTAWKAYAADLNKAGAMARAAGLRFGFHNHFWEFSGLEDDTPLTGYDILVAETDPKLVHFEVDLYWAWFAHRDPVGLLAQIGERILQFHVKDMKYVNHAPTFADAGTGVIDFARIFRAAGNPGGHEYIIERDDAGANALQTAQVGYNFLSRIRF
jgi:sugar phosphate isomerase/epimerase